MYSFEDIFKNKKRVLFVMAHPDDVDVFFGGSLARLAQQGKEIFVLIVTSGGRGSQGKEISETDLGEERLREQTESLKILGLEENSLAFLDYLDGEVENNLELIGKISKTIRQFSPEVVCTHEPHGFYHSYLKTGLHLVNHRDHRLTGVCALDAIYPFSRDRSFFKEQIEFGLEPCRVFEILLAGGNILNTKIDITQVIDKKKRALLCHKTQFDKNLVEEILQENREGDHYFELANYLKLAW